MAENTNLILTAEAWAEILIEKWQDRIRKMGLVDDSDLLNSFESEVMANAGGDLQRIDLAYLMYGLFQDMGVGKGVKLEDAGTGATSRRPSRWYSSVFYGQVKRLAQILASKYGRIAIINIVQRIENEPLK